MMRYFLFTAWLVALLASCVSQPESASPFPPAQGQVNDYANLLSQSEEDSLTAFIQRYEKRTSREIAVVTLDSIPRPYVKEFYMMELANEWGVGKAEINNGALLGLSTGERYARISTGLGTEKQLTNPECQFILDSIMLPHFKQGQYYLGFRQALDSLTAAWGPLSEREKAGR